MAYSAAKRLRVLLASQDIVVAPGAYDGLSARLVEQAGFAAIYCTGGGISRSRGLPDLGYTTLSELVERVASMAEACSLPMVVDADAGFGSVLNLGRAVKLLSRAGAAGLHIEDMEIPNRRRQSRDNVVGVEEMCGRLRAALEAREDRNFLIIARTDVLGFVGMDEAVERARRYADVGADLVYVESLKTRAQMEEVARRVQAPKLISINAGESDQLPAAQLARMGYKLLTIPADAQLAAIHAMRRLLGHLKKNGCSAGFDGLATFAERDEIVATAAHQAIERRFLP